MSDKYFLDTNIFVYSVDQHSLEKHSIAKDLILDGIANGMACISYQVIQEFINVSTKKFSIPLNLSDSSKYVEKILEPLCEVFSSFELFHNAIDLMERWKYSFYDSLIIAAAIESGCAILYSEDLQHNQKIYSLTIVNPFFNDLK